MVSANVGPVLVVLFSSPALAGVEVKPAHLLVGVLVAARPAGGVEPARAWSVIPFNSTQEIEGKAGVVLVVCAVVTMELAVTPRCYTCI
jgi:hypothetical protein